uniref:thioredoxin-dependent peroxiredoxin n=1 Tax=Meloidogyne floridensis TaxID=298350 RepID=A0A915P476_9BILA
MQRYRTKSSSSQNNTKKKIIPKMTSGQAKIGKLAPEFTTDAVVDSDFKTVSLSDYKGKYVVLFFYPLDLFPRKEGGLGEMKIPVLSDRNMKIARDYGVLKEDEGIAYRGLFIIDPKGILRQITINDLPVGRSVDETLRLVQAFQYTDKHGEVC